MSEPLLEAADLRCRFGGVVAVSDMSFSVAAGEVLGIVGPNGSGKTTMVNLMTRLTPVESGRMFFRGSEYGRAPSHSLITLGIARTFQNLRLFDDLSVWENVALVARRACSAPRWRLGRMEREVRARCDAIVQEVGLQEVAGRQPDELPYGMQRRVEIARALAGDPALLFLDEPFAGMSGTEAADVSSLLLQTQRDRELTLVVIDHNIEWLRRVATRLLAMADGSVIASGDVEDVLSDERVVKAYVGGDA